MFLRSVDASDKVKDATLLFELLDEIIQEVGEQNVVQVITDNASNYVLAGKMLESKYNTIFWTPCAAHCIDLMLEDIGKVEWVKNTVEHGKCITKYIYNHSLQDLQLTSSRCNVSILNRKTWRKCFLLMIGLNPGGLVDKMEKTPKRKSLTVIFGKGLQSW